MKRIILAIAFLFSLSVQSQVTYLHVGDRLPNLYYWDTNWWDYYHLYKPVIAGDASHQEFWGERNPYMHEGKVEAARYFYIDSSLTIIGVAAAIRADTTRLERNDLGQVVNHNGYSYSYYDTLYVDTSMANREDEYFRLYKPIGDSMELLAEALWDTKVPPRFMICVGKTFPSNTLHWTEQFAPLYEAYFANPVTVSDSFYVSNTANNNYKIFHNGKWRKAHPFTIMYFTEQSHSTGIFDTAYYGPKPGNVRWRYHMLGGVNETGDTNWHGSYKPIGGSFRNIFPIFDTSRATAWVMDSCTAPKYLELIDNTWEYTTIAWNMGTNSLWEMAVRRDSDTWDNAVTTQHTANFATLTGLDTAEWYVVRVRAICDSGRVSPWSNSMKFYVPGNTATHGTERIETVVDRYTHLIPNPAHGQVRVLSSFFLNTVEIYTLNGRLVERRTADGIAMDLDLSGYTPGVYIVRIVTPRGTAFKKLVVQ